MTVAGGDWRGDYEALRHGAGALVLGRDVVGVRGPDASEYLQGQLSQDIAALGAGEAADSLVLSPQGKLDALVRVVRLADDRWSLDTDAGFGEALQARLARFRLRVKVEIAALPWRCVAVRGPGASAALAGPGAPRSLPAGAAVAVEVSWNGVTGVDLLGEAPEAPAGVARCAAEAWEAVRVEAGIPRMGAELDERTIAAEAGLVERTVSFTKGCYTGQELVARLDARGNRVARRLCGLVVAADAPGGHGQAPVPVGAAIVHGGKAVGTVTSAAWSPALSCPVALGYVHRSVAVPGPVELHAPASERTWPAEVRALPLV
ncbi:MAG TPA: glycine cleavage T C-terminal barrel domain-containing protein [Acidimicrobiales bacterium]|nr:glycine cleavage T C-terminal barrel domain-containing protein [Acidimicrobiales bacterium]